MEIKIVSKDLVELNLAPEEHYLTVNGVRELIKMLSRTLFDMAEFGDRVSLSEK